MDLSWIEKERAREIEDREKRVMVASVATLATVSATIGDCFRVVGRMDTGKPHGDAWQEADLTSGQEIPCDNERDALNQLRVMVLGLAVAWGRSSGMVFVRCEPHTTHRDGFWQANVRLFRLAE